MSFFVTLRLDTASLSALGYEKSLSRPVIRLWNDTHHLPQFKGAGNRQQKLASK
jgi:hypothetical protein